MAAVLGARFLAQQLGGAPNHLTTKRVAYSNGRAPNRCAAFNSSGVVRLGRLRGPAAPKCRNNAQQCGQDKKLHLHIILVLHMARQCVQRLLGKKRSNASKRQNGKKLVI
ncbi:MAG: hypothetical protein WCF49_02280 [Xanthobacteraceae bacterium]